MRNVNLGDILGIILGLSAVIVSASMLIKMSKPLKAEGEAIDSAYSGEIVDKELINASKGIFTYKETEYRITINVEYEYEGETKNTTKYFTVDKETYSAYDIGDWFDSHNLKNTKVLYYD
ncbi:hypothetical protein [Ruminococcus sp.]|uniref:hypothetical protein n=1 Tax=Ruminococcus sp. TaxID=41978 RepID=UPI0025D7F5C3|nr:hypothetical protein [Ruminococcus sp.]